MKPFDRLLRVTPDALVALGVAAVRIDSDTLDQKVRRALAQTIGIGIAAVLAAAVLATLGLTREQAQLLQTVWFDLHHDEASWSSRGREILLEDAHHYIQFERPDAVVDAVREVVGCVRTVPELCRAHE